jgi:ATP-dependent endonuclease
MNDIEEIFKQFNQGEWKQFIKRIKITNIHGWEGQEVVFNYPVVALVGENGIGKSTFLKAAVCAYENCEKKTFYPSKMFMSTYWDESNMHEATIEYVIRYGNDERQTKWKKTKDWGYTPKKKKPKRAVYFLDISRTLPLDATAGYAKIAMRSNKEIQTSTELSDDSIKNLSYVLGQEYTKAVFTTTAVDATKPVGLLTKYGKEISQFHQGAGEDSILDLFKLLQSIKSQSLLVIDEVENSLHPQAQRRLVRYLLKLSRQKKIQVILSTHSPFVLEELPEQARIMLIQLIDKKSVLYNISCEYALSTLDCKEHPEAYVHVEDEEARTMFWEIMRFDKDHYDSWKAMLSIQIVGSSSTVAKLAKFAEDNILPYKSVSVVDGDVQDIKGSIVKLPGKRAPEKEVFCTLKERQWSGLDECFDVDARKYLNDAMLDSDHHRWVMNVADKLKMDTSVVWRILVQAWCRQVLTEKEKGDFVQSIRDALHNDPKPSEHVDATPKS